MSDNDRPADDDSPEGEVTYEELQALVDGELDGPARRRLQARIALDPAAAARLAAVRTVERFTVELRAAYQRRVAEHPELAAEDLEMSEESTARIIAAIEAEVARQGPDQQHPDQRDHDQTEDEQGRPSR